MVFPTHLVDNFPGSESNPEEYERFFDSIGDFKLVAYYLARSCNFYPAYEIPTDYNCENMEASILKSVPELKDRETDVVVRSALAGNAEDCLEAGLRSLTGCKAKKSMDDALHWFKRVGDPDHPLYLPNVPLRIRVRALSLISYTYWAFRDYGNALQHGWAGIYWANEAAYRGFITVQVLNVGLSTLSLREGGLDTKEKRRTQPSLVVKFERDKTRMCLRDALNSRKPGTKAAALRAARRSKNPLACQCAAEGCGIEVNNYTSLKKCSGKCPEERKPYYCSRDCQVADWRKHKAVCLA
ncbi:hypothetical protein K474DRAFT_1321512 [Panus rudis PR-1116 ss-1]|nr:hypothetical protein K474DRAFT_1321512 [Panus rudis PR-1116 ss-1]